MRGVAPLLHTIIKYIKLNIGGSHAIDEQENAICFQNPRYLAHELRHVWEVVSRDATGDALKAGIFKRELFGVGYLENSIGNALLQDKFTRLLKHSRSQVRHYDLPYPWRDSQRRMPAARRNIQRSLARLPFPQLNQPLQVIASTMR